MEMLVKQFRSILAQTLTVVLATVVLSSCALAQSTTAAVPAPSTPVVSTGLRLLLLFGGGAVTFALYSFLSGLHPLMLIVGLDNRYSNSKFQVALWFFMLISVYLAFFAFRMHHGLIGGIEIPQNLFILTGMSAFTYGAAKGITTSKVNDAIAQGKFDPKTTAIEPSFLNDLTHSDVTATTPQVVTPVVVEGNVALEAVAGRRRRLPTLDLGDTQMVVVTLLAVGTYLCSIYYFFGTDLLKPTITLPNVDNTILSIFGLGHGAYLTKKAVGNVGEA
jgi:hypothetical protein